MGVCECCVWVCGVWFVCVSVVCVCVCGTCVCVWCVCVCVWIQWALQQSVLIPADVLRSTPCTNDLRDTHMPYLTQQTVCHCARVLISTLQQMWDTPTLVVEVKRKNYRVQCATLSVCFYS